MRVAVVGATGVLGRAAVPALLAAGHGVRASSRDEARSAALAKLGAEVMPCDLFDGDSLRAFVAGAGAVVNLATRIPTLATMWRAAAWRENDRIRAEGSRLLVDAALGAGAELFLQESITFVYPNRGDSWIDEEVPLGEVDAARRSAVIAEGEAARFAREGGRGIVLRFSALYGPDAPSTLDTARLIRRRLFPIAGDGSQYFSSIHADDAGAAIAVSLAAAAGVYNVSDDEPLRMEQVFRAVAKLIGAPAPWRAPAPLARVFGGDFLLRSHRVANARLRAAGWAPRYRSAIDGWRAIVELWRDRARSRAA